MPRITCRSIRSNLISGHRSIHTRVCGETILLLIKVPFLGAGRLQACENVDHFNRIQGCDRIFYL